VAYQFDGTMGSPSVTAVVDAAHAKPVIRCTTCWGGGVWAPDSRSVYVTSGKLNADHAWTGIDRLYLSGRRTHVIPLRPGSQSPQLALATALVYSLSPEQGGNGTLYRHDFTTGRNAVLFSPQPSLAVVLPLKRIP
jgi:hypothetical protein